MNVLSTARNPPPAAVIVSYNGCDIVPAPLVDFTVTPVFGDDGTRQSNTTRLVLTGSIVILPSGSYEQMYTQQEALRNTFSVDEKDFVIRAGPGNKTLNEGDVICSGLTPKVIQVNITPDIHVTRFDYTVELEDSAVASGVSGVTSSFTNEWSFSENADSCVLDVTHRVSATGPDGDADAFLQAQRAVKAVLGIDQLPLDIPCFAEPNASGGFGFTHPNNPNGGPIFEVAVQREETADVANGTYSVTEVFTIVSGVPFFHTQKTESYAQDANGISTVTLAGTVQGLGRTLSPSFGSEGGEGFFRACSGFNNNVLPFLPSEAQEVYTKYRSAGNLSGLITTNPTNYTISQNKCRGTIAYSITYSDDISANLPSGIVSASSDVQRTDAARLQASHVIPFRRIGNLIQDIKTTTEGTVTISAQATSENTGDPSSDTNRAITYVEDELNRLRKVHANSGNFITLRIDGSPSWQISDRSLSANASVTYIFTTDLASVQDVDSDISIPRV